MGHGDEQPVDQKSSKGTAGRSNEDKDGDAGGPNVNFRRGVFLKFKAPAAIQTLEQELGLHGIIRYYR